MLTLKTTFNFVMKRPVGITKQRIYIWVLLTSALKVMVKDAFNYIALIGNSEKIGCHNGLSGKHRK